MFFLDNLANHFFPDNTYLIYYEITIHFFIVVFEFLFAYTYLKLKSFFSETKLYIGILIAVISIMFFLFVFTGNYDYVIYGYFIIGLIIFSFVVFSLILIKKSDFAKYYFYANLPLFVFTIIYYISPFFEYSQLGINLLLLKIGNIFELTVLSYAII